MIFMLGGLWGLPFNAIDEKSEIMKRISSFVLLVMCVFLLASCDSKKIADAKTAFSNSSYQEVITLLEGIEMEDPEVKEMLLTSKVFVAFGNCNYEDVLTLLSETTIANPEVEQMLLVSKVNVAFNNNNYREVVDLFSGIKEPDDALLKMQVLSQANLLFEEKQYFEVVAHLAEFEEKDNCEAYSASIEALITSAISDMDVKTICAVYKLDGRIEDMVFGPVVEQCNAYEYSYFVFADGLVNKLPDCDLKAKLETYLLNNGKTRAKAFMRGEWKMFYEDGDYAAVKVHVNSDDSKCIGILTHVADFMKTYFYEDNDLYWSDFMFDGDVPVSVSHLVRYTNGSSYNTVCSFEIDFENNRILIHVTGTTKSDRIWERVA